MRIPGTVAQLSGFDGFPASEPARSSVSMHHRAHESFRRSFRPARFRYCAGRFASPAQRCAHPDLALPAHAVAAGRLQLLSSADLLGLWVRSDRAIWPVGRRMDDSRTAVAMPPVRNIGHRQRSARGAARCALVPALALWTLARRQRAAGAGLSSVNPTHCRADVCLDVMRAKCVRTVGTRALGSR